MIRKAVPEDMDIVYKLISELEECEFPKSEFKQIYDEILDNRHHCILLYENNSEVMGILHLRLENQLHHCGRTAEIMELIILDGHRSEGIGSSLIDAAYKYAMINSCVSLEVTSNCKRTGAHIFYKKNGMELSHYKFTMDTA
ncbi:MAG: GNAT family N-acetyltransferase [Porcipelethomonas sp.]